MNRINIYVFLIFFGLISCKESYDESAENILTANEKTIQTAYEQMMVRFDIPMDSMRYYYQKLDNCHTENPKFIAVKKLCQATYLRKNGSFQLAIPQYKSALEHLKPADSLEHSAFLGLGVVYKHIGDFPTALDYFQKSIEVAETRKRFQKIGRNLYHFGSTLF